MTASATELSGLAPPTPLPCERCGHAPPTARVAVAGRRVCLLCAEHLAREAKPQPALFPTVYVLASGLLSPLTPPILAAINWSRLGDRARVRTSVMLAFAALLTTIGQSAAYFEKLPPEQVLPFSVANLLIAFFATMSLWPRYAEHRERGGKRANLILPVVASMLAMATLSLAVLGYLGATGKVDFNEVLTRDPFQVTSALSPSDARTSASGALHSAAQSTPNSRLDRLPSA